MFKVFVFGIHTEMNLPGMNVLTFILSFSKSSTNFFMVEEEEQ
jgi:hypothetical protein